MNETPPIPEFKSEAVEAAGWDSHPDETLALIKQATTDGSLERGKLLRGETAATSIRLDTSDIKLAKVIAQRRGLRYQTYLKMIIHQHLVEEVSSGTATSLKP